MRRLAGERNATIVTLTILRLDPEEGSIWKFELLIKFNK